MYIAIEGIDGCGKDTQLERLYQHFKAMSSPCLLVTEPGDGPISDVLRSDFLKTGRCPKAHHALFLASRMVSVTEQVVPFEAQNPTATVLSSRSLASTLTYQQKYHALEYLIQCHKMLPRAPDLIILLDIPPELSIQRIQERGRAIEYYETLSTLTWVRNRYLELMDNELFKEAFPDTKMIVISGVGNEDEVFNRILGEINNETSG
jgi:dTMP kinase